MNLVSAEMKWRLTSQAVDLKYLATILPETDAGRILTAIETATGGRVEVCMPADFDPAVLLNAGFWDLLERNGYTVAILPGPPRVIVGW